MKKLNVDLVQVATMAGSLLTLIGGVLTANAR